MLQGPRSAPRFSPLAQLIAYSADYRPQSGSPAVTQTAQIPANVPFVAANGNITAYVRLDALLLSVNTDNAVRTAFALENAGVSQRDIASLNLNGASLVVRVVPITAARVRNIVDAVKAAQTYRARPVSWSAGFLHDCGALSAGLGGLALVHAERHARVIADAAHITMGDVLGVVDSGATVTDAICGVAKDANVSQLAKVALFDNMQHVLGTPQLYATVQRSVSAAWRLNLPANSPGTPSTAAFDYGRHWWGNGPVPAFIADGSRADGAAVLARAIEPTSVRVFPPEWTLSALRASSYARNALDLSFGIPPLRPQVLLTARDGAALEHRVSRLLKFLSGISPPNGAALDVSFLYARADCSAAIDAALAQATQDALTKTRGRIRYLEERSSMSASGVSCTYEPAIYDYPQRTPAPSPAGAIADVIAGY